MHMHEYLFYMLTRLELLFAASTVLANLEQLSVMSFDYAVQQYCEVVEVGCLIFAFFHIACK